MNDERLMLLSRLSIVFNLMAIITSLTAEYIVGNLFTKYYGVIVAITMWSFIIICFKIIEYRMDVYASQPHHPIITQRFNTIHINNMNHEFSSHLGA
jgi:hypothetical protein